MPTVEMPKSAVEAGTGVIDLFFSAKLGGTKSDIRRLIEQGGASINGNAVSDVKKTVTSDDLDKDGELVLRSGKKKFVRVVFK